MNDPDQQVFRDLLGIAQEVRSRFVQPDCRFTLRDIYSLSYHLARELRRKFPDLRIMVGDRIAEHGFIQHHWIEIPSSDIYIDPAADVLDPFHPVRIGRFTDAEFSSTYRNGFDANIDLADPRNRPELLFKAKSLFDSEA